MEGHDGNAELYRNVNIHVFKFEKCELPVSGDTFQTAIISGDGDLKTQHVVTFFNTGQKLRVYFRFGGGFIYVHSHLF